METVQNLEDRRGREERLESAWLWRMVGGLVDKEETGDLVDGVCGGETDLFDLIDGFCYYGASGLVVREDRALGACSGRAANGGPLT